MSLNARTSLKDLSADERTELERIADLFFGGITAVFRVPFRRSGQDRYRAMLLIHNYVSDRFGDPHISFINRSAPYRYKTVVKPGKLEYCYDIRETSCYDGGCCGTDCISFYLFIEIVSDQELQSAKSEADHKEKLQYWKWHLKEQYWDRFPDESHGEYVSRRQLYLSHPFHTTFNLRLTFESR